MQKRRFGKKFVVTMALLCCLSVQTLAAENPYRGYSFDYWGEAQQNPNGYSTHTVIYDIDAGQSWNKPSDLFIDKKGNIYILDSGNNRVLIYDKDLCPTGEIAQLTSNGEPDSLKEASGLYVNDNGVLYVADTGNKRVVAFDKDGVISGVYTRPETAEYTAADYLPQKVLTDHTGAVYVVCQGVYEGAVCYNPDGTFSGFYGTNDVEMTLSVFADYFWKSILSAEAVAKIARYVPEQFTNFDIDQNGFVYTCTAVTQTSTNQIKKLSPLGVNILQMANRVTADYKNRFGDLEIVVSGTSTIQSAFTDICVDEEGFISALDTTRNRVFQYDTEGNLLFVCGGQGSSKGLFVKPVAVETYNGNLYVLDAEQNCITTFSQTKFGAAVRGATRLYNQGLYIESEQLWDEVLAASSNFSLAYTGKGKALYEQEAYRDAADSFRLGEDRENYGKAFEALRAEFIRSNLMYICMGILVFIILILLFRFRRPLLARAGLHIAPPGNGRVYRWMKDSGTRDVLGILIHPVENTEELKRTGNYPFWLSGVLAAAFFVVQILRYQLTGFCFNYNRPGEFNILIQFVSTVGLLFVFCVVNWSVTTLMDGKGRIKEIWFFTSIGLIPYIAGSLLEVILSCVLTVDEGVFLTWIGTVTVIYSIFVVMASLKGLHSYSFGKIIASILMTLVLLFVLLFVGIILFSLFQQITSFFSTLWYEVLLRMQ